MLTSNAGAVDVCLSVSKITETMFLFDFGICSKLSPASVYLWSVFQD